MVTLFSPFDSNSPSPSCAHIHTYHWLAGIVCMGMVAGCASDLIEVRPGSTSIPVISADQVSGCAFKGNTTVSVFAQAGVVTRSVAAIDADLEQLARNAALDAGGDTLVKGERPDLGKQVFGVYRCKP